MQSSTKKHEYMDKKVEASLNNFVFETKTKNRRKGEVLVCTKIEKKKLKADIEQNRSINAGLK